MADQIFAHVRGPERRRVLFLSQIHPLTGPLSGAQLRVSKILDVLVRHHDVTFAVATLPEKLSLLEQWPVRNHLASLIVAGRDEYRPRARWGGLLDTAGAIWPSAVPSDISERAPQALLEMLRPLAKSGMIDVVWASRSWMGELARMAGFERIAVDVDDFEAPLLEQDIVRLRPYKREPIHRHIARRLRRYEQSLPARFNAVVVVKDEDRAQLDGGHGASVFRVSNGVDLPVQYSAQPVSNSRMLFVGTFSHAPNIEAMRWFVAECLPRIRQQCAAAELVIAGKGPIIGEIRALSASPGVRIVESPEHLHHLYNSARAVVAPIRSGNGTRIKVLEALAHARPLVATTEAAAGFAVQHNHELLLADTTDNFANACVRLLTDDALCLRLATHGRAWVEANGTWSVNANAALEVIEYVARARGSI
jgi:glycosyltransferase involved in cell wall biosynthesis